MQVTLAIGEFKTHCYQVLDQAQKNGHSLLITRKGKPLARILPIKSQIQEDDDCFFDSLKDSVSIKGDIVTPIDVKWSACDD